MCSPLMVEIWVWQSVYHAHLTSHHISSKLPYLLNMQWVSAIHLPLGFHYTLHIFIFGWWCHNATSTPNMCEQVQRSLNAPQDLKSHVSKWHERETVLYVSKRPQILSSKILKLNHRERIYMVQVEQGDDFRMDPATIIAMCWIIWVAGLQLLMTNEVIRTCHEFYGVVWCIVHDHLSHELSVDLTKDEVGMVWQVRFSHSILAF